MFSFPRREGDWGSQLGAASRAMIEAMRQVQTACPVTLLVGDPEYFAGYRDEFSGFVVEIPTDDCWVRDSGPITVFENGRRTMLDFTFNGWGGKFVAERDNAIPRRLHDKSYADLHYARVCTVLEGGAIETDGQGTIITTTRCLLSTGRNDYTSRAEAEEDLRNELGASCILWIDHGELEGDDTDAHVDTLARFLDPQTIAYVGPPTDRQDAHYASLLRMREQLHDIAKNYRLVELPFAAATFSAIGGHRLPATYANFLISNGHLFLPTYDLPTDAAAGEVLRRSCDYRIVEVDCRPFIEQHGSLHCLCMQIPANPTP